jgi:hypothetical protein
LAIRHQSNHRCPQLFDGGREEMSGTEKLTLYKPVFEAPAGYWPIPKGSWHIPYTASWASNKISITDASEGKLVGWVKKDFVFIRKEL